MYCTKPVALRGGRINLLRLNKKYDVFAQAGTGIRVIVAQTLQT